MQDNTFWTIDLLLRGAEMFHILFFEKTNMSPENDFKQEALGAVK